jgi:hypothetical protein
VKKGMLTVRDNKHSVIATIGGNEVVHWKLLSCRRILEKVGPANSKAILLQTIFEVAYKL